MNKPLAQLFDDPIHPNEVRERLYALEQHAAEMENLLRDEIQRRRISDNLVLMLSRHHMLYVAKKPAGDKSDHVSNGKAGQ